MNVVLLQPDRWGELPSEILSAGPHTLPSVENGFILGAYDGARLVGCIGADRTWAVSPLYLEREYRGRGIPALLAERLGRFNTEGLRENFVTTSPHVAALVRGLGFVELEGTLWRRER